MSQVITTNDGYLALLDAVYFAGVRLGNLSEEGLTWGGEDAQKFSLFSAQQRSNPVKEIQTRAATNELSGKMIELLPENCVAVMGGRVVDGAWEMPANMIPKEGSMKILTGTGQTIDLKRVSLSAAYIRGGLGGEQTLGIQFSMKLLTARDGTSPGSIKPTTPFISANPTSLTFTKTGGSQAVEIEASGPFSIGNVPDGFLVELINGRVTVTATENTGSAQRTGKLTFVLEADATKNVEITLTQSA